MGDTEQRFVTEAFASNYIAPLGPMVDAFEKEFSDYTGIPHCLALSSGTAATHLALRHLLHLAINNQRSTTNKPLVLASTLTFIGSVTPAVFEGCDITFIDCDRDSWNMDPALLEEELADCRKAGRLPVAVIPTDLYGQCCNLPRIKAVCDHYQVPVICDSAEAMGARYQGGDSRWSLVVGRESNNNNQQSTTNNQQPTTNDQRLSHAGNDAWASVYSFNGNKIITTSGGGMLASHDKALIDHARKLSQQARDPAPWYEHTEIGYNYRLSNILAAIGRGQLQVLDERVRRRREIFEQYQTRLASAPGISLMPEAPYNRANRWLTVILIDPVEFGTDTHAVRQALERENIEARPVWKPMHLQPVFKTSKIRGGKVSEHLFEQGLCLPSGSAMTHADVDRVVRVLGR